MEGTARLRVDRPCLVDGEHAEPGQRVELPLLAALDAAETGRLSFVDPADQERAMQARRQAIARDLRRTPADPGSPWVPVGTRRA